MSFSVFFLSSIVVIMLTISLTISLSEHVDDNQLTPLESGFESMKQSVLMSSSFFMMATLFVIFDVELIFLLPFLVKFLSLSLTSFLSSNILFILILISLLMEWTWFGLKWSS